MPHSLRQTLSRQDMFTARNKMDKNEVISFFDIHSTTWDENMEKDDSKMNEILDVAKISSGKSVLDIACGTGVMIDYYIERNVSKITGVDISSKMIEVARNKFKKYDFIDFLARTPRNLISKINMTVLWYLMHSLIFRIQKR